MLSGGGVSGQPKKGAALQLLGSPLWDIVDLLSANLVPTKEELVPLVIVAVLRLRGFHRAG